MVENKIHPKTQYDLGIAIMRPYNKRQIKSVKYVTSALSNRVDWCRRMRREKNPLLTPYPGVPMTIDKSNDILYYTSEGRQKENTMVEEKGKKYRKFSTMSHARYAYIIRIYADKKIQRDQNVNRFFLFFSAFFFFFYRAKLIIFRTKKSVEEEKCRLNTGFVYYHRLKSLCYLVHIRFVCHHFKLYAANIWRRMRMSASARV